MKFYIIFLFAVLMTGKVILIIPSFKFFFKYILFAVTLTSSANPSWDSIEREIEQDNSDENYQNENEKENYDEPEEEEKRELVKRADKSYLSAQK